MSEHECSMADAIEMAKAQLQRAPLVWIEDGYFIVRDEKLPGFRYDFACKSAGEALRWTVHLSTKSWITKEHLEQFAGIAADHFKAKSL